MATNLADLSPDAVGLIFDLVDSSSLLRGILVGCTRLNSKIFGAVSRFKHEYSHTARCAKWPKLLASFLALKHLFVYAYDAVGIDPAAAVYDVDLMALPSTLCTLELHFDNDFFCLASLPLSDEEGPFSPRLRPGLKDKFPNLQHLSWHRRPPPNWDVTSWKNDVAAWLPSLGLSDVPVSLLEASKFPSTTYQLSVELPLVDAEPSLPGNQPQLPSSLVMLSVSKPQQDARARTPNILASELWFLKSLQHLTSLEFSPTLVDSQLLLLLPRSLQRLQMRCVEAELESFAHFPQALTWLEIRFQNLFSSTTGARNTADELDLLWYTDGLPLDFLPSMRETVVMKLPSKLSRLPASIWELIRPRDWEVFPSKCAAVSISFGVSLDTRHIPFIPHLPIHIQRIRITARCTPQFIEVLPRQVRHLTLHHFAEQWDLPYDVGSDEERQASSALVQPIFESISQRLVMLHTLQFLFDTTFDLATLHHLQAPNLRKLQLTLNRADPDIPIVPQEFEPDWKVPSCFAALHHLHIDSQASQYFGNGVLLILQAAQELKEFSVSTVDVFMDVPFPSAWVPFLPPKLQYFSAALDLCDLDTFKSLPRSIQTLNIDNTLRYSSRWDWPDLLALPPNISRAYLPCPKGESLSDEATLANLNEMAKHFVSDPSFLIGGPEDSIVNRTHPRASITSMIAAERSIRSKANEV